MDNQTLLDGVNLTSTMVGPSTEKIILSIVYTIVSVEAVKFVAEKVIASISDVLKQRRIDNGKKIFNKRLTLFESIFSKLVTIKSHAGVGEFDASLDLYKEIEINLGGKVQLYLSRKEQQILNNIRDIIVSANADLVYNPKALQQEIDRFKGCL